MKAALPPLWRWAAIPDRLAGQATGVQRPYTLTILHNNNKMPKMPMTAPIFGTGEEAIKLEVVTAFHFVGSLIGVSATIVPFKA
jgi:hypothetical protein